MFFRSLKNKFSYTNKKIKLSIAVLSLIFFVQFFDMFSKGLYDKLQSLYMSELLINSKNMTIDEANAFLSLFYLPFLSINILTPLAKMAVDYWGKDRVLIIKLCVQILGLLLCFLSSNIYVFLIGSALITFCCSLGLQQLYIVGCIPKNKRATVQGVAEIFTVIAAISIPALKSIFIDENAKYGSWRYIYAAGMVIGLFIFFFVIITLIVGKYTSLSPIYDTSLTNDISPTHIETKVTSKNKTPLMHLLLLLFILGSATAGITFYNEPFLSVHLGNQELLNIALFIQPISLFLFTLLSGIVGDHTERINAVILDIAVAGAALVLFIYSVQSSPSPVILGVLWGAMVGCYFSAINLIQLKIMELSPDNKLGTISAVNTFCYGAGNGIGILISGLIVSKLHMGPTKLIMTLPILGICLVLCLYNKKRESFIYRQS